MLTLLKLKWKLVMVVGVGIAILGLGGWYFLGNKTTPTVETATVTVAKGDIKVTVSANGTVEPMSSRELTANSGGTITKINFRNGQQIQKGDLLFTLDEGSVLAEIAVAQLDIQQAQLQLNTIIYQRKQLQVNAPINGRITSLPVSVGQDVAKNLVLMTVQDTGKLTYKVSFNGAQVGKIFVGQKVDVVISSMFSVLPGKVKSVDRLGVGNNDGSIIYKATVELANPGSLSPGIEAQADIHTAQGIEQSLDTGGLEPSETISIRSGVTGTIRQLPVTENSHVQMGQKVALLSNDSLDTEIKSQEIKLKQLRLKLAALQTKLTDYRITAPFSGVVNLAQIQIQSSSSTSVNSSGSATDSGGQNYWQVGDEAKNGQALASIVGSSGMLITVPVDEVDIAKVKGGQKANITVDAFPGESFKGTVSEVAGQGTVKNNVANFDVTLTIDEVRQLKSGMTAYVEILIDRKDGVLVLPIEAVQERQGKKFVEMAGVAADNSKQVSRRPAGGDSNGRNQAGMGAAGTNSNQAAGRAQMDNRRRVETGLYNERVIEITSGLAEGDKVVIPAVTRSTSGNNNRPQGPAGMGGFGGQVRTR
ncbi:MAG: HlyD family efflux transporter periplasmic adaptor subunit [Carboxydocellales bacterium]